MLAIQASLVSILYLLGRGGAAVFGQTSAAVFTTWDALFCTVVAVIGLGLAGVVIWRERHAPFPSFATKQNDGASTSVASSGIGIIVGKAVTLESLFQGRHYSHRNADDSTNEQSKGSDAKISTAEAKLGFALPEGFRAIYRTQNGGSVPDICIVKPGIAKAKLWDDIIQPFGGYDDLLPAELLRTLHDSASDFADPDD